MARPRKIRDGGELRNLASDYATVLYLLRYGRKAAVLIKKAAPYRWFSYDEWNQQAPAPRDFMVVIKKMDSRKRRVLVSRQKVIGFAEVSEEDFRQLQARKLQSEARGLEITLWPPVSPDLQAWDQLKWEGSSANATHDASKRIRRWAKRFNLLGAEDVARVVSRHVEQLRYAKKLPHYPRTERPGSDDKRIQFLAKVIAGLSFGAAPLYVTKRLGGLRLRKEDAVGWGSFPTRLPALPRLEEKRGEKR